MVLLIETKRDQRVIAWLFEQVGEQAVLNACEQLAGGRRAYPSNVAKILGLIPPKDLTLAAPEDAAVHIARIRASLGLRPPKDGTEEVSDGTS